MLEDAAFVRASHRPLECGALHALDSGHREHSGEQFKIVADEAREILEDTRK